MSPELVGWLIAGVGAFTITGAVLDWDWFMNSRKARVFMRLLGRNGARAFYVLLGSGLATLGVLIALGIIQTKK